MIQQQQGYAFAQRPLIKNLKIKQVIRMIQLSQRRQQWSESWMLGLSLFSWMAWATGSLFNDTATTRLCFRSKAANKKLKNKAGNKKSKAACKSFCQWNDPTFTAQTTMVRVLDAWLKPI
jgi:hypothetical protein